MKLSTALLLCGAILIVARQSLGETVGSGDGVPPVRQNPLVIPGVGDGCPDNLRDIIATTEQEAEQLLSGVVGQIECTYLGNC